MLFARLRYTLQTVQELGQIVRGQMESCTGLQRYHIGPALFIATIPFLRIDLKSCISPLIEEYIFFMQRRFSKVKQPANSGKLSGTEKSSPFRMTSNRFSMLRD